MNKSSILIVAGALAVGAGAGFWAGQQAAPAPSSPAAASSLAGSKRPGGAIAAASGVGAPALSGATLDSLLKTPGQPDQDALAVWAKGLTPQECAAALAQLKDLPSGLQRNAILEAVVNAWAASDPQGFLGSAGGVTIPRVREEGIAAALKAWAAQNPQDALKWFQDNPGSASGTAMQDRYAALVGGMAMNDPKAALELVNSLGEGTLRDRQLKNAAMRGLSDALAEQGRFTDAMGIFATLPPGTARNEAYDRMIQRWAEASPQEASAWLTSLEDPALRAQLGPRFAASWAANDPLGAAAWAAKMDADLDASAGQNGAPNPNSGQLLANAILAWASHDIDGPAEYLNTLEASPTKDRAVSIFAVRAAQEDPQGAMEWVGTITDPNTRNGLAGGVAFQWMQQDPEGLKAYAATSPLFTDEQRQRIQQIRPQDIENLNRISAMLGTNDIGQRFMEGMILNAPAGGGQGWGGGWGGGPPPAAGDPNGGNQPANPGGGRSLRGLLGGLRGGGGGGGGQ